MGLANNFFAWIAKKKKKLKINVRWFSGHVCLLQMQDFVAAPSAELSCSALSVLPRFHHLPRGWSWWAGADRGKGRWWWGSVHKSHPESASWLIKGDLAASAAYPLLPWLVAVYLFRVTRGQSRLTSNHQEQPELRPSINKKCVMKVRGRRTRGGGVGVERG